MDTPGRDGIESGADAIGRESSRVHLTEPGGQPYDSCERAVCFPRE